MPHINTCTTWEHGYCPECNSYKKDCKGFPVKPDEMGPALFRALGLEKAIPGQGNTDVEREPEITLVRVDVEHNTSKVCTLEEAKTWDWKNIQVMRVIGDWQITSYEMLVFKLREKEESGLKEVKLFEAPRFMILCGG